MPALELVTDLTPAGDQPEAIAGTAERFDVFAKIRHADFPGGPKLRRPALVLAMLYYRLPDLRLRDPIITVDHSTVIRAAVHNYGPNRVEGLHVKLMVDGRLGPEHAPLNLEVGEDQPVAFNHTFTAPGDHLVAVQIDDDPLKLDNTRWLAVPVREHLDLAKKASPTTFISKDDPPFLIMHGDRDELVPISQSELFNDALKAAGVDVKMHVVKGAGHGFRGRPELEMVADFFKTKLAPPAKPAP